MQRTTLQELVETPSPSQSQALRARIIPAAADGQANQHIARVLRIPEITVRKWRRRFA
jgi:DNA-binding NarL/FixJ family response regulator